MEVTQMYELKPTRKPADFIRQLLLQLGKDSFSPTDIFQKIELDEKNVTVWYDYFLRCKTTGTIKYSMSVGYDRKETYTVIEEKYDQRLGRKVPVEVVKERTVTDWRPYLGTASGEEIFKSTIYEKGDEKLDDVWVSTFFSDVHEEEYIPSNEAKAIPQNIIEAAKRSLKNHIFFKAKNMGDHQKDERVELTSINYESVEVFKVPFIGVTYKYDGKTYSAVELACGSTSSPHMQCTIPRINKEENPEKKAKEAVKKEETIAKYLKWATWGLLALYFAFISIGIWAPHPILTILTTVPCAVGAIVFKTIAQNKYFQILRDKATSIRLAKLPHLEEALKVRNLAALTEAEKESSFKIHEVKEKTWKEFIKDAFKINKTFIILVAVAIVIVVGAGIMVGMAKAMQETI